MTTPSSRKKVNGISRLGGQAYQKPHFYYLHRIALIEAPIFGRLLPARRRRSQGSQVSVLIEPRRSRGTGSL